MLPIAGCVVAWWKSLKFREVGGSAIAFASTRASKANVYVIRFLAVLCLCNDGTFSRLRLSAAEFCQPDGNRTRPDTSPPQRNPLRRCRSRRPSVALVSEWRIEMPVEKSRRTALVLATLAVSAIALAAPSALAACPVHAKPMVRSIPRVHVMGSASTLRASRPQPQSHVDDPFASLLLG